MSRKKYSLPLRLTKFSFRNEKYHWSPEWKLRYPKSLCILSRSGDLKVNMTAFSEFSKKLSPDGGITISCQIPRDLLKIKNRNKLLKLVEDTISKMYPSKNLKEPSVDVAVDLVNPKLNTTVTLHLKLFESGKLEILKNRYDAPVQVENSSKYLPNLQ